MPFRHASSMAIDCMKPDLMHNYVASLHNNLGLATKTSEFDSCFGQFSLIEVETEWRVVKCMATNGECLMAMIDLNTCTCKVWCDSVVNFSRNYLAAKSLLSLVLWDRNVNTFLHVNALN
jgi:hypothetical protein